MKNNIHPTSIIEEGAKIGLGNIIGENVIIRKGVEIGSRNLFGSNIEITNNVKIGDDNKFNSFISIGSIAEMGSKGDFFNDDGCIIIGNQNTFREFITINSPARTDRTIVGNKNYFMARTHIPHDAKIGSNIVFATNLLIGGGCIISDYVYIGLNASVHQWTNIGEGAILGQNSSTLSNVPPFMTAVGTPSKVIKINLEGLIRRNISNKDIELFKNYFDRGVESSLKKSNYLISKYVEFISNKSQYICL